MKSASPGWAWSVSMLALVAIPSKSANAVQDFVLLTDGASGHVTMGQAPGLGATTFTIETWFKRLGTGETASSGDDGVTGVPLVCKGRRENGSDGNTLDTNYFLVVKTSGVIASDFEGLNGGNHPVSGVTVTEDNVWYHAAMTFDGSKLSLYLNGQLEDQKNASATPRSDSLQHFAIGSALSSTGAPAGFFAGLLREARVWNYARSQQQIQDGMNATISSASGLLGRWALTEGTGTTIADTTGNGNTGTIMPGTLWSPQFPPGTRSALQFTGNDSYVTMGRAPELGLADFTLECWVKATGTGQAVNTDAITAYPLVCKGRRQEEGNQRDANYFLGIKTPENVLAADFERMGSGGNQPVTGTTRLLTNVWYHVAATYDHSYWRLYLNGRLEKELACTADPRSDSNHHFSIATAMNNTGLPVGFFNGVIDEVRVWNGARTQQQIQESMYAEAISDPALVGHWTLNENIGSVAGDGGPVGLTGFIRNATWTAGVPFASRLDVCTLAPADVSAQGATLQGALTDLGGAQSADLFFRWGYSPDLLDQVVTAQNLAEPGLFDGLMEATAGTSYYYKAVADTGAAVVEGPTLRFLAADNTAFVFDNRNWMGLADSSALGLSTFTLECWFNNTGPGTTTDSGATGVTGRPLITKGRGMGDGGRDDCNYFLAISHGTLAADFEDMASGANHPVYGTTLIEDNVWYHAAATYDGTTWRLYLNGRLEAESLAGATPRYDSSNIFTVGSTLNSFWNPDGRFEGIIDEVRVWNYARSRQEIVDAMNLELPSAPGLVARWGFNEKSGPMTLDTSGSGFHGYFSAGDWAVGAPFDINALPDTPSALAPPNEAVITGPTCELRAHVADADGSPLQVKFFARQFREPPAAPFRIIALPDTQYYSDSHPSIFTIQTQWIVNNRNALNIAYVAHEGDIVDNAGSGRQWQNANAAISILDTLPDLPYGLAVGNHDQSPNGDPSGTGSFNNTFPYTRYEGRPWYGGHHGPNNDNHYILFRAGSMDFIAIHLEFNDSPSSNLLSWVGNLLQTHANRRAIIVAHSIVVPPNPPHFSKRGSIIYDGVKDYPNVFLMLCGHNGGEAWRTDVAAGTIHSLVTDYQWRDNGGNGWLRVIEFVPGDNVINVKAYSPKLNRWERDNDSEFSLPYDMGGVSFTELAATSAPGSGADVAATWTGLEPAHIYEWYATASDGRSTVASPVQRFTTPAVRPDFDADGHVDSRDLSAFESCSVGPGIPYQLDSPPPGCTLQAGPDGKLPADFDGDLDVDHNDFGVFQRCYSGSVRSAQWNCAD